MIDLFMSYNTMDIIIGIPILILENSMIIQYILFSGVCNVREYCRVKDYAPMDHVGVCATGRRVNSSEGKRQFYCNSVVGGAYIVQSTFKSTVKSSREPAPKRVSTPMNNPGQWVVRCQKHDTEIVLNYVSSIFLSKFKLNFMTACLGHVFFVVFFFFLLLLIYQNINNNLTTCKFVFQ